MNVTEIQNNAKKIIQKVKRLKEEYIVYLSNVTGDESISFDDYKETIEICQKIFKTITTMIATINNTMLALNKFGRMDSNPMTKLLINMCKKILSNEESIYNFVEKILKIYKQETDWSTRDIEMIIDWIDKYSYQIEEIWKQVLFYSKN